jgi:parvulin-like peptidyl-prolyl isomerase
VKLPFWVLALLLATSWVLSSQTQKAPSGPAPAAPKTEATGAAKPAEPVSEVPPEAAVLTLNGVCPAKEAKPGNCKIVVTRAQFDKLLAALVAGQPGPPRQIPPADKRRLAMQYARMLYSATQAENQGLASRPETQARLKELLAWARLQVLEQELRRELQEKSQPSPADIEKYYNANPRHFTELTLDRILIPLRTKDGTKPDEAALKTVAEDLRQRAASGTDAKTLQTEAYEKVGLQNPPDTRLVLKADRVVPVEQAILQLKPGEVSQVIQEPAGFYIFKLEGQRLVPLSDAKPEIQNTLATDKFRQETEELLRKATPDLNTQYFGAPPTPAPSSGLGFRPPMVPPAPPPSAVKVPGPDAQPATAPNPQPSSK